MEFFASPFLVQEWELTDKNETKKDTLLLKFMLHNRDVLFFVRLRSKFGCLDKLLLEFLMNDKKGTLHEVVSEVLSFEAKKLM